MKNNNQLNTSLGITKGLTIMKNNISGSIFVADDICEKYQCKGENRQHIIPIGDLSHKITDVEYVLREFTKSVLHGDDEHKQWLLNECEKFIEYKLCDY